MNKNISGNRFNVVLITRNGRIVRCAAASMLAKMAHENKIAIVTEGKEEDMRIAHAIRRFCEYSVKEFRIAYGRPPDSVHDWKEIAESCLAIAREVSQIERETPYLAGCMAA